MFDAFCKEVLRNTVFNYKKKKKRDLSRELITPDPEEFIDAKDAAVDSYETDHLYINFDGRSYPMDNEKLYQSMLSLPRQFLGVLLLKYWDGMQNVKIAAYFNVTSRTVRNWRNRAIDKIKRWYEERNLEQATISRI
jgi:DNA-directed RNA polymerase specialized sigma24 family protein